jgi:L-cysteine/cystine lyase
MPQGELRELMPALANKTYFNYGGQGPLPDPSLEAMVACWRQIQELGPFSGAVWPYLEGIRSRLRRRLASWLGVGSERLAFTENVSSGCVLPLWGLPWQPGERLLLGDCEHPGIVAACRELARRQGLAIDPLPVADLLGPAAPTEAALLERLEQALQPRTRLVVLSHLLWNTGQLMPISAVAQRLQQHPLQPWLLVDGAQSLGSIPVAPAAAAADIYACTGHKWCCGPEGLGVVALSERLLQQARPTLIGWRGLRQETPAGANAPLQELFQSDARRFEVATSCLPLFAGLDQSLELLEAEGSAAERLARIQQGSRQLWQALGAIPQLHCLLEVPPPAGLVSFQLGAQLESPTPAAVVQGLGEQGIWIRSLEEPACLRACTHLTSTAAEIDQLVAALAAL